MATKKETAAADAVENAVETVEKAEAATEEKDDGMVTMPRLEGLDTASARELRNYLYQMQEQLEYILSNIDTENLSGDLQEKLK